MEHYRIIGRCVIILYFEVHYFIGFKHSYVACNFFHFSAFAGKMNIDTVPDRRRTFNFTQPYIHAKRFLCYTVVERFSYLLAEAVKQQLVIGIYCAAEPNCTERSDRR